MVKAVLDGSVYDGICIDETVGMRHAHQQLGKYVVDKTVPHIWHNMQKMMAYSAFLGCGFGFFFKYVNARAIAARPSSRDASSIL